MFDLTMLIRLYWCVTSTTSGHCSDDLFEIGWTGTKLVGFSISGFQLVLQIRF